MQKNLLKHLKGYAKHIMKQEVQNENTDEIIMGLPSDQRFNPWWVTYLVINISQVSFTFKYYADCQKKKKKNNKDENGLTDG